MLQALPFIRWPLALLPFIAFVPACADKPEKEPTEKQQEEASPRLVGRVASIPADRKFVLIQSYGTWNIATGAILTTQGPEGRAANLRATGEKLGQFAAADIQSGTLEIGDGVYSTVSRPEPDSEPETKTTKEKPLESVSDGT
ncbi:MAG: hypothetical protein N2A42_03915 [Luteolibacter sp.]